VQWAAILASNILYEKFWQPTSMLTFDNSGDFGSINGVGKNATGAWSVAIYPGHKDLHTWPTPLPFNSVLPREPYISHKSKAKREIHRSFVPNVSCAML
jgi:hypothetical protein